MLQIRNICKQYQTGSLIQKALDDVSLNLRDNEFVAILGPSGSGKTTLLNIIGGLDRYDSGDLIINDISTKNYKDRDWDSYRNHTIGFVFQSYNLIPHQTILANVELALTISGISKDERREKAVHALEQVGLGEQLHKKPNQLSGGQMQRVAIARALVNDPDILLADEPTGALDSDTSVQVMELLKEVAKDRLVVMVTHNPELAEEYATRIVNLRDGKIRSDNNPYEVKAEDAKEGEHRNMGKTSMSFLTSLALSFNNLRTKKGRTILTAFAGSIGIIGIALILSLSNGVNNYIKSIEEETLSEYPLQIQSSGFDMSGMMPDPEEQKEEKTGDIKTMEMLTTMFATVGNNDLESLKAYLDSGESGMEAFTKAIEYSYPVTPQIYREEAEDVRQVHPDKTFGSLGVGSSVSSNSMMSSMMSTDVFYSLPEDEKLYKGQYDVKAGRWPKSDMECVLVLSGNGNMSDFLLYTLGLRDSAELQDMVDRFAKEEEVIVPKMDRFYDYEEILGTKFKLVSAADYYAYDATYDVWKDKREDAEYMKSLVQKGEDLDVVGIVQPKEDATAAMLRNGIYYPNGLVKYVIRQAENSEIVKAQQANPEKNVFTGKGFEDSEDSENAFDMNSLFTVDEEKMKGAFRVDESKLRMDLSGLNSAMSSMNLPPLDMTAIIGGLNFQMSTEQMRALASNLMGGYEAYAKTHPEADFSQVDDQIVAYMQSPEATMRLKAAIEEAIKNNGGNPLTSEQMQAIFMGMMEGYYEYASSQEGYQDISKIGEAFAAYLASAEAKTIISQSMADFVTSNRLEEQISAVMGSYMQSVAGSLSAGLERELMKSMQQMGAAMQEAFTFDTELFAEAFQMNMTEEELAELMASMMSKEIYTYEGNLQRLGYAEFASPAAVSIYPKDFESKEKVVEILNDYNEKREKTDETKVINYTDIVGTMMSSVTTIVNVISYVLIAFVAISLVVSSIMIGVITYISVLERKKEIGILRAIGASKRNISQVFNAETFIIGALAGVLGIGITLLLLIPANQIIHTIAGNSNMSAALPPIGGVVLIVLSILLTLIGGIIPSRKAAKEDPVTALRTE